MGLVKTDVSEEHVASIFRTEEITRVKKSVRRLLTSTLKTEAIRSSESRF
jgi:hypothetical protein